MTEAHSHGDAIAIIGMAGRWPRARNRHEFWQNVRNGVDCVSRIPLADLEITDPAAGARDPDFVAARSVLDQAELFDAEFFGIHPNEAERIDPQHRVFLECCWEAFEDAGYVPGTGRGAVGVFAGCSVNTYFLKHVCRDRAALLTFVDEYPLGDYQTLLGALSDSLATRVAYKLNLRGPSMTIQTACSTSLVAVCQACQSLQNFQCDMALAGAASITFPQKRGYRTQDGAMGSIQGRCRPFDASADGTVFGSGVGVVLLKRLDDALADGDSILAVIKGYAVNNDGSEKAGYTAPSLNGQASVIAMAHAMAEINPESISYLEAHGTATPLGDPIEIAALTQAFRAQTQARAFCALGTAKANVGHLEAAAGVTGLINAVQALVHEELPPLAGFVTPNAILDLDSSPFFINTQLSPWKRSEQPRRAGVSSFGIGGTNAHVVLEEAPARIREPAAGTVQLITLSARSAAALENAKSNLIQHFELHPEVDLADVAFTLQAGRSEFAHRAAIACSSVAEAMAGLKDSRGKRPTNGVLSVRAPTVVFMFPGQASQFAGMGAGLYQSQTGFRCDVDRCAEILAPLLGMDLRDVLLNIAPSVSSDGPDLRQTAIAQPALFTIEYALARHWMRWGVHPKAMIGHSIGEFAAACLAGVLTLEDALAVVAARGRLMQEMAPGAMTAVRLPQADLASMLNGELSLAAINAPNACVVSGPHVAIHALEKTLVGRGVAVHRLATSHAFHSRLTEPILRRFEQHFRGVQLREPSISFVSGVTGDWITAEQATDPAYWVRHLRETVQFSKGIETILQQQRSTFLEVGPGHVLSNLVRQHGAGPDGLIAVASLPRDSEGGDSAEQKSMLSAAGELWLHGIELDWSALNDGRGQRCSLPTYPFERKRFWIEPPAVTEITKRDCPMPEDADELAKPPSSFPKLDSDHPVMPSNSDAVRAMKIRQRLVGIFEGLSGLNLADVDPSSSFLELGFDSLFLTQVTQALRSQFGVQITFRQLLDQQSSLAALTEFLDRELPPDPPSNELRNSTAIASQPSAPPTESLPPQETGSSGVEALMREQLSVLTQFMAKQLEVVRGTAQTPGAASAQIANSLASASTGSSPKLPGDFKAFGPFKPIQRAARDRLSENQKVFLEDFIRRYTSKTAGSKRQTQSRRPVLADPRVVAGFRAQWKEMVYPIVTLRSRGSRLWDVDGNEYIDLLNGFGPILFGHAPQFVTDAVAAQLREGFEIGPQTPLAGEVAALVCELTGNERATFCNTGSEAVLAALRVARTVTGRNRIALFAGAYHGTFDEVLGKGITRNGQPCSVPIAPGIPGESLANVTVLEYGSTESLEYIRRNAESLAAVLVEPVQSRHPELRPIEFLQQLRQITEQSGTALIFDEIVTGFRVHPGGAQALFGIRADLTTYGKVAGGGMPIGILAGRAKFMDALDGGMWQYGDESGPEVGVTFFAGTFVRHPLALAASRAILQRLKAEGPALQQSLNEKTTRLVTRLNEFLRARGVSIHIERFASWFFFSFSSDQPYGSLLYFLLREKGIHIQEGFPCFLTTAHSDADLSAFAQAFEKSIIELQSAGFLPSTAYTDPKGAIVLSSPATVDSEATPLTDPQVEVLLSARLSDEASCAFNEAVAVRLNGALDAVKLGQALQMVVERHDALRSTIDLNNNSFRVLRTHVVNLPRWDWSGLSPADRNANLAAAIVRDAQLPFDLENGPLVRFQLFVLASKEHVLLITAHHIVCDGWSMNVMLAELGQIYSSLIGGSAPGLLEAPSFQDYARDHQRRKLMPDHDRIESWWAEQFAVTPPPLELPTDRARGPVKSFRGGTVRRTIGKNTYQALKQFGARQGCTLFATLLAGFQSLLHRLTGQPEIVVGIPAAGQSKFEADSLVGHCVNFLPIRSSFSEGLTAARLLSNVRSSLLDAFDHQDYTYGSLIQKLGLKRDPSRLPLVEVQFNLERVGSRLEFRDLEAQVDPCPKRFVNFDLFLNAVESDDGLVLDCDYNNDLFDETTIERWLGHLETFLKGMLSGQNSAISELPILSEIERNQLLFDWNDTAADYPRDKSVHQLFAEQAARTPEAIAAVCGDRRITYVELDAESNRLSHFLHRRGVGAGTRVAVCLDRSVDMLSTVLAILKAGAAYVPIDPDMPRARVEAVLSDAEPTLVLVDDIVADRLGSTTATVIRLGSVRSAVASESDRPLGDWKGGERPAYMIYTSGSTGTPKAVQVPHRAVVNLLTAVARRPGFDSGDILLAVTTLAFDTSVIDMFLPLSVGGMVAIATRDVTTDGFKLLSLLESSGATVMQATPTTWRLLLAGGWNGSSTLKVICTGEALPRDLANELTARSASVWNMYGPTETTVWSCGGMVETGSGPPVIGKPIANTQLYVLDTLGHPVPIGVAGELHVGGDCIATGYWNRPELTAEKFTPDQFRSGPGRRLYKTGDLVRYRADGTLEYLGRRDNQVKIRGYRIELGEIEYALVQCPGVRECVVVAREEAPGEKKLVAYLVSTGRPVSVNELRSRLRDKLPPYMLPSQFVELDALPLTPTGKIDRRALPTPRSPAMPACDWIEPQSPREQTLAGICQAVLHIDRIGIHNDLFDLGMDSLQMFQILARARDHQLEMTPRQVMSGRTVAAIIASLDSEPPTDYTATALIDRQPEVPRLAAVARDRYRSPVARLYGDGDSRD